MNFYQETGELIIGSRLKRLSDKFIMDVSKIYDILDIDFEISWFPLFYLLNSKGELSVTEIARELEITHSGVSQLVTTLQKRGLIEFLDHESDKRKKIIGFTKEGNKLIIQLKPVWESLSRVFRKILAKGEYSSSLLEGLTEVEECLRSENLHELVIKDIQMTQDGKPNIIPFDKTHEEQYKKLLLDWLLTNGNDDIVEAELLSSPDELVSSEKGYLLLAEVNGIIAGTVITKFLSKDTAQVLLVLVKDEWQNRNIGNNLLSEIKTHCKNLGISKLQAVINKSKQKAIKLLSDNGFVLNNMYTKSSESGNGAEITYIILEQILS